MGLSTSEKEETRLCHDEDCPKCGFPETVLVCEGEKMKPIRWECSANPPCGWTKKYPKKTTLRR